MKKLAIIGGGVMASYFGEACHRLGYEGHYFSLPDGKVDEKKVDFYHEVNIFDKDKIVDICREINIDGVVATTELTIYITAYVANKLNLLGNPVEIAKVITNKYRNREAINGLNDLLSPKYMEVQSIKEIENADFSYPIILKPISYGGKRGITVVNNASELSKGFDYAADCFPDGVKPRIIAEEFLAGGIECSVESISFKGEHTIIQITQKDSGGAPHCVELGHHQPASISAELWNKVTKGVSSGLTAIGLTNGPCHTEIKIINDEIYLIEFNARPGGDHISWPMVELSTGFDFIAAIILASVGELKPIDRTKFKQNYSGLYYVVKQTEYLKKIYDTCEKETWCWERNYVTEELVELVKNDMEHTNYIIYSSETGDPITKLLENHD